jgi:ribosomal-protein-serine acetyltransferase
MQKKFKDKLRGKRLVLKRGLPEIGIAEIMFGAVQENRKHLRPWLPWEKHVRRVEDMLKYLFGTQVEYEQGVKVDYGIYLGDNYIGNIGIFNLSERKKSGEIGYWLSDKHTRQGYMSEAVRIMEKEFFGRYGLNRIQIRCDVANHASSGVAKKCGYVLEGRFRQDDWSKHSKKFRDTFCFSKLRSEYLGEKK